MEADHRPNILVIMADQWAADAIGGLGHPAVKTPNIDRLVEHGTSFVNAYCNSPICAPSRASFCTGKLTRNHCVYDNGTELPAQAPTLMHHLRLAGYETVLSGKMHFIGPDQLHGFERRLTTDIYPAGFNWTPDWRRGTYANKGTSVGRLKTAGPCTWNTQLAYDEETLFRGLECIREYGRSERTRPLYLCASFTHPHCPFTITQPYWDLYENVDVPEPVAPAETSADLHAFNRWIQIHHECDRIELSSKEVERARRAYYGMVSYFDDCVGKLLAELNRCGLADDTLVVVTSDHGEMLGEHGMWFKRTFFDPSMKIPLVVRWPGRAHEGKRLTQIVSLVDLAATILDAAGATRGGRPLDSDGESFLQLVTSNDPGWKDEAVFEYFSEGSIRPLVGIRRGRYKYVHVHEHPPVLYDLEEDPHELHDLAHEPRHAPLIEELKTAALDGLDLDAVYNDILSSQQRRLLLKSALEHGERTSWDFQPHFDATQQYVRGSTKAAEA